MKSILSLIIGFHSIQTVDHVIYILNFLKLYH